ncbi:MAG TPA: VOC family protein [Solirubrobacteraceae bacterium]|jgi:catechol 2,3-dioxygenase-like lactoylglutathione lyase family enzyme|nr:VOC family protein [Solirubrobacteraceae bacterium]
MDDARIVALLSSIEPSEGEIPKPPFMAAIPAGPVIEAGADIDAVEAWVKARGGWTHRTPAHLAGPEGERPPLFFIVPKGHLQGGRGPLPGGVPVPAPTPASASAGAPTPIPAPTPGAAPSAGGLTGASLMAFVATSDLAAARAFYGRGLGLPMTGQSPIACTFDAGGTTLRVNAVEKPVVAPYTVLGWTVADIAATVGDLAAHGVDFERFDGVEQDELGIWSSPGGALVAWFKDPDGNTLSLTQF